LNYLPYIFRYTSSHLLELLCFILAVSLAKLFLLLPLRKNLISIYLRFLVSLYFCLSCMSHEFFRIHMIDSYSVFNEHSLDFFQSSFTVT